MQHADSCYRVKMISAVSVNGNRPCPIPDMCPQGYFIPDESTRSAKQASHPMAPRGAGSWLNGHGHLSGRMHAAQDFIYFVMNRFFFCIRRQRHRVYLVSLART